MVPLSVGLARGLPRAVALLCSARYSVTSSNSLISFALHLWAVRSE